MVARSKDSTPTSLHDILIPREDLGSSFNLNLWNFSGIYAFIFCTSYFSDAVIKESQASVFIADKSTFLYEANEDLSLGEQRVELLISTISTLQES